MGGTIRGRGVIQSRGVKSERIQPADQGADVQRQLTALPPEEHAIPAGTLP